MKLGKAISLCRQQREMKQADLARKAGISASYLSMLEQDKRDPTMSTINHLAEALGVPMGILLYLAAEQSDLVGIDPELSRRLSHTALEMLREDLNKSL